MKLRDSGGSKRINVKLNSEDHANNNFSDQLKKPGAILESDPYIWDADEKSSAKSCLDQLCLIFTCSCLQKNNQVRPVNGLRRFEPHSTTSVQNGGHNTMGNGLAGGIKNTTSHNQVTRNQDKSAENSTKNDDKTSDARKNLNIYSTETGNFEASRKGVYTIPVEVNSQENLGRSTGTGMASQSQYPNAKAKENIEKLFKMPDDQPSNALIKSDEYNSRSKGNYKQSTIDPSYYEQSKNSNLPVDRKDNYNGTYPANSTSDFVNRANAKPTGNITSSSLQQSAQNYAKNFSTVSPPGNEGLHKSQENDDTYRSRKNNPQGDANNYGGGKTSFGTPHPKNPYQTTDRNSKNQKPENSYREMYAFSDRNDEERQHQQRQKHSESNKVNESGRNQDHGMNHGGGQFQTRQKNSEATKKMEPHDKWGPSTRQQDSKSTNEFSNAHSRDFVDNYRKKDDVRQPVQNSYYTNPQTHRRDLKNSDKKFENLGGIPGDAYSKNRDQKNTLSDKKKNFSEYDQKRGEKSEMSRNKDKKNSVYDKKKDFDERNSKLKGEKFEGSNKNSQRDLGFNKSQNKMHRQVPENPQKTSVFDRNGRGNLPSQYVNDEFLSDDDEKLLKESHQFQSESVTRPEKNRETSILNPARLKETEEQDYHFSKENKMRPASKGSQSADSTRRDAVRKSDSQNEPKPTLTKDTSRGFKSVPDFDDEFKGSRAPQRIEPLGDTVRNDNASLSENRSSLNNYTASTSVHHRLSHIAPMQQNDYMALPAHIVNLPDEDMDFSSNGNAGVEKSLVKSVSHSKSYENLNHRNGFGERFKYNSSQQRRQPETKSIKGSSLYPSTLQPFDSPKDALEKCLLQIESPEWEIVMQSLQGIVRLSRYHPEVLVAALHRIVTGLSKQIRSLRSQVSKAACVVSQELFEHLGKIMDPEIEELAPALLSRTFDANKFLQHDANSALDSMIDNVSPVRSAAFLLLKGAKHRNAVVRTTACRLLARLCQNLGTEQIYSLPRDTRDSLLNTAAKFLLEGSLETRAYAKELFSVLAREPKFMRLMNEVVPAKTMEAVRKPLIKIISQK